MYSDKHLKLLEDIIDDRPIDAYDYTDEMFDEVFESPKADIDDLLLEIEQTGMLSYVTDWM